MKYAIDRKLRTRGEIYSISSGLMHTLNERQAKIAAILLSVAAVASAGIIIRGILLPDSSFIISGEKKPQTGQAVPTDNPDNPVVVSDTYVPPISEGSVNPGGFKTLAVQVPTTPQLQPPSSSGVTQPVSETVGGGMGGGTLPDTPDTECGCVNRAIDKVTGTATQTLNTVPGF